jgi:hypothetical protein
VASKIKLYPPGWAGGHNKVTARQPAASEVGHLLGADTSRRLSSQTTWAQLQWGR